MLQMLLGGVGGGRLSMMQVGHDCGGLQRMPDGKGAQIEELSVSDRRGMPGPFQRLDADMPDSEEASATISAKVTNLLPFAVARRWADGCTIVSSTVKQELQQS